MTKKKSAIDKFKAHTRNGSNVKSHTRALSAAILVFILSAITYSPARAAWVPVCTIDSGHPVVPDEYLFFDGMGRDEWLHNMGAMMFDDEADFTGYVMDECREQFSHLITLSFDDFDAQAAVQTQFYESATARYGSLPQVDKDLIDEMAGNVPTREEGRAILARFEAAKQDAPPWDKGHDQLANYGNRGLIPARNNAGVVGVVESVAVTVRDSGRVIGDVFSEPRPGGEVELEEPQPVDDGNGGGGWPYFLFGACLTPMILVLCGWAVWKAFFGGDGVPRRDDNNNPIMGGA